MYDLVAGRHALEPSYWISRHDALEKFPMLKHAGLKGGIGTKINRSPLPFPVRLSICAWTQQKDVRTFPFPFFFFSFSSAVSSLLYDEYTWQKDAETSPPPLLLISPFFLIVLPHVSSYLFVFCFMHSLLLSSSQCTMTASRTTRARPWLWRKPRWLPAPPVPTTCRCIVCAGV